MTSRLLMTHFYNYKYNMFRASNKRTDGYIALLASVIISVILLVLTMTAGSIGWSVRMSILEFEAKAASAALAYGCANYAIAEVVADSNYVGNATTTYSNGSCFVYSVDFSALTSNIVTIHVVGIVRYSYTTLEVQYNIADIHNRGIPVSHPGGIVSTEVKIVSMQELD